MRLGTTAGDPGQARERSASSEDLDTRADGPGPRPAWHETAQLQLRWPRSGPDHLEWLRGRSSLWLWRRGERPRLPGTLPSGDAGLPAPVTGRFLNSEVPQMPPLEGLPLSQSALDTPRKRTSACRLPLPLRPLTQLSASLPTFLTPPPRLLALPRGLVPPAPFQISPSPTSGLPMACGPS